MTYSDTNPEALKVQIEAYRAMGPLGRLEIAFELSQMLWEISEAGIRSRHPEYSAEEVRKARVRLTLGEHLYKLVYADDADHMDEEVPIP
jgi:hypothetical protein